MGLTNLSFYLVNFSSFTAVIEHSDVKALLPFMTVECVLQHSLYLYGKGARRFQTIFMLFLPFTEHF